MSEQHKAFRCLQDEATKLTHTEEVFWKFIDSRKQQPNEEQNISDHVQKRHNEKVAD